MNYTKKKLVIFDEPRYYRVRWLQDVFNRYENYYQTEIYRMITNQRMYWGVNFGQWPAYAVEKLTLQGRRAPQFNIIARKIEGQIGSYLSNGFDIKYVARNGKNSHWPISLLDMMYSDKSNCDWESSEIVAMRDMHVMVGYERMFISDRNDSDFGNIAWEPLSPTHVFLDPEWRSVNAWDIDNYFDYADYSADKICRLFPKVSERIKELREREARDGIDYGDYMGGVQRYTSTEGKWGSYHRVITFHHIVEEERNWEYDLVNRNAFPETSYDPGSKEDQMIKQEYIQQMGLQPGEYTKIKQKRRIKRIECICPTLDNELLLMSGKDRIQTNNCNIYPIGNNLYGQFRGVVDDLTDLQLQFNKGKMMVEDILQRSAKGAFVLDKALTGGDERMREEIESQWNNPAARLWVDEGTTADLGAHGGIIELPHGQVTPDMFRVNQENIDLADRLSSMPAAMDSRVEGAGEPAKMMQTKIQTGLISQKYGMKIYERHKKEKAAAYPLQAKITYAGYPREFRKNQSDNLIINQPGMDNFNRKVIINDISIMPEMDAILTPSASGTNLRSELRTQYADVLPLLEKDPQDRLLRLIFVKNIFTTQDMAEDEKEEIDKACKVLIMVEAQNVTMKYMQGKAALDRTTGGVPQGQPPQGPQQTATPGQFDRQKAIQGTPQEAEYTPVEKGAVA
jgi:hypothetical protein